MFRGRCWIVAVVILSRAAAGAVGSPYHSLPSNKEIQSLEILAAKKGRILRQRVTYASIIPRSRLTVVTPHPTKNPKKESNRWSGITIRKLFERVHVDIVPADNITFGCTDAFVVQLAAKDINNIDVLLATHRDGKRITWFDGGPQLIFPLLDPRLPEKFRGDSWWAWAVSGIFVNDLPPIVSVRVGSSVEKFDLRKNPKPEKKIMRRFFPPGQREILPPKTPVETSLIWLDRLMPTRRDKRAVAASVQTQIGEFVRLQKPAEELTLRYLWDGKPISPSFGGAVQLCEGYSEIRCVAFVDQINVEFLERHD